MIEILHRDDLPKGGFAGVREYQLVKDVKLWGSDANLNGSWGGLGNFAYLADARFMPNGETGMHPHREIDVISVMVEGRLQHEGSLQHGQELQSTNVQVQRAGGEGFEHNEINPDPVENRMIQLWVLPEEKGQQADYKFYQPAPDTRSRVYGGSRNQQETLTAKTTIDIGLFPKGKNLTVSEPYLVYLVEGAGFANGTRVKEGDLFRGDRLQFDATENTQLILIGVNG